MPHDTTKPAPDAMAPAPLRITDLEIKDAQLIFGAVWQNLETELGLERLRFPKEIIHLGGASSDSTRLATRGAVSR